MGIAKRLGFVSTICLISVFIGIQAGFTQSHSTKSKCKNITYQPDESIDYKPNQSVDGWALTPVNAHPSAIDLQDPQIALDLPTGAYVDREKYNFNFDESRINVGRITVEDDRVLYNDQEVTPHMQDCVE